MSHFPYSYKVLQHFRNPKNVGCIDNPDAKASRGSPLCGDMVNLYLKINSDTLIIEDIKFESYGCASNIATGSIITEIAKGRTIEDAKKITWESASKELGGLPAVKVHCSVLAVEVLHAAIKDYEEKNGLTKPEDIELNEGNVKKKLSNVINPHIGKDIIFTKTVKQLKIDEGNNVIIKLDMNENDQFANNIREEIEETLENLKGIKNIIFLFQKE